MRRVKFANNYTGLPVTAYVGIAGAPPKKTVGKAGASLRGGVSKAGASGGSEGKASAGGGGSKAGASGVDSNGGVKPLIQMCSLPKPVPATSTGGGSKSEGGGSKHDGTSASGGGESASDGQADGGSKKLIWQTELTPEELDGHIRDAATLLRAEGIN